MCNGGFIKIAGILLLAVCAFLTIFGGCEKISVEVPPSQADLNVFVGFSAPVSGTLYCDVYGSPDFTADPGWSASAALEAKSGIAPVVVSVLYSEVTDNKIYLRIFLDENTDGVPDGDELCEYYGNLSPADLISGRTSTPIAYSGTMSADVILDKKCNDAPLPAPVGLEVNAFYTDAVVGQYLFCLVFKGSVKNTYKEIDWKAEVVQLENSSGVTRFLVPDITGETEVYFLVESQPTDQYGAPAAGLYFEYYSNKTVDDSRNKRCNTVPVNSAMDVILDVKS